jgi:3-dehydroquinate dehydratase/shikimate dehydrogenase
MIIVSVTGPTISEALRQIRESRRWADIFELRLDLLEEGAFIPMLRATRKPRIVTVRPRWEGGEFDGSEKSRLEILKACAIRGAEFVDVELKAGRGVIDQIRRVSRSVKIIVSHHASDVPRSGSEAFRQFRTSGGDIWKWAYPAEDSPDLCYAIDFLRHAKLKNQKAVAIAMGEPGEASRILYRVFGGWATYAAPEGGPDAAPGQITGSIMKNVYRASSLNSRTRVFGLLGNPVAHSQGAYLHNLSFHHQRANAVYVPFRTIDLKGFLRTVMPFVEGCSVTLPFKEVVATLVPDKDSEVTAIGAGNTLFRRGKRLRAANSDAVAALDTIEERAEVKGRTVLIVGAGGAARAIAYEAKRRGATVLLTNRTVSHAEATARALGIPAVPLEQIGEVAYDILVNATPAGMFPRVEETAIPGKVLRAGTIVFDVVANPPETRLLREAREVGAIALSGAEMFVRQAARQQELFIHKKADLRFLRRAMGLKAIQTRPARLPRLVSGEGVAR